jgi:O-antigen/teichoic acid export membrane protein
MTLKSRQKLVYFLIAFVMYLVFKHLLGPQFGLEGIWLTITSYVFALIFPSIYLYRLWTTKQQSIPMEEPNS